MSLLSVICCQMFKRMYFLPLLYLIHKHALFCTVVTSQQLIYMNNRRIFHLNILKM